MVILDHYARGQLVEFHMKKADSGETAPNAIASFCDIDSACRLHIRDHCPSVVTGAPGVVTKLQNGDLPCPYPRSFFTRAGRL